MPRLPTVVVGAGLAGACAAAVLAQRGPVTVLGDAEPGASGAAAGLVHPFTGRRAHRAWRAAEARAALERMAARAGVAVSVSGVLRPAQTPRQAADFREAARLFPEEATWTEAAAEAAERWPGVACPLGALWIPDGGHVSVPAFVRGLLDAARRDGADVRTARLLDWDSCSAITDCGDVRFDRLVLCPGHGVAALPQLAGRPFGYVRGQTVTLGAALPAGFPAVAGGVYVVPTPRGAVVGATFEHAFSHLDPDPAASADLRARAARLVPALADAEITDARVGVRVTVPTAVSPERLPVLERVAAGVWLFTGLGSRGLLTAPLLAETLPDVLPEDG